MGDGRAGGGGRRLRLRVACFRGVREVGVEAAPLTIVTGRNNAGKSSLLEALALAAAMAGRLALAPERDPLLYILRSKGLQSPSELVNQACQEAAVIELGVDGCTATLRLAPAGLPGGAWAGRLSRLLAGRLSRCLEERLAEKHLGAVGHAAAYTLLALLDSSLTGRSLADAAREASYPVPPRCVRY